MMSQFKYAFLLIIILFVSCKDSAPTGEEPVEELPTLEEVLLSEEVTLDPSGVAPLTAVVELETDIPVQVEYFLEGKNGEASDVLHHFDETNTQLRLPILGLYPNEANTFELTFFTANGQEIGSKEFVVETEPVNENLPEITIDVPKPFDQGEGWTLVSYYGYAENRVPHHPFIFDSFGDIRWYCDFREDPVLNKLNYNDGMERLHNGNFYFGFNKVRDVETEHADKIYEMNMLGEILNTWEMPGYKFHHEVHEKPNGNFVITVDKIGEPTIEDYVIEIDRNSGGIINVWDLNESLDNTRNTMTDNDEDWFHANAVLYDESDNTIVVSGRTQGVVKLTQENEVVWIMGPHRGWKTNQNGINLRQYLLAPLDSDGHELEDGDVWGGSDNDEEFEWNWYQHAPMIMPNGNILLFDNGDNRNYEGTGPYSRAVEFKVDEEEMTIQQVWAYGKERGEETYSRIVSDVDFQEDDNSVIFSPGAIDFGNRYGKVIEIDYNSGNVVFEATITAPDGYVTFHRTERLSLYPQ